MRHRRRGGWQAGDPIYDMIYLPYKLTMGMPGFFMCFSLSYIYAKKKGQAQHQAGFTALVCYILVVAPPLSATTEAGAVIDALSLSALGTGGIFVGILIAFISVEITKFAVDHDGTLKLPDSIPEGILEFGALAHKYGFEVSGDCNGEFFAKMEATPEDLSVFKEMGVDIIRMDFAFHDERDARLINNKEGLKVEMSTGSKDTIELALKNGADPKRLSTCRNFYPLRCSAPCLEAINGLNEYWKERDIPVAIFISSGGKGPTAPGPCPTACPPLRSTGICPW